MTDTVKFDKGNIKMIAHRGLSGIETENTAVAFVAAGNRSYYGIETDVRITADGQFVILHDNVTGRLSEKSLEAEKSNLSDLKSILLNDREDGTPGNHIRIAELDDYLKICRRYGKVCVLEIKSIFGKEELLKLMEAAQKRDWLENVIFISFYVENLYELRKIAPEGTRLQFLCGELSDEIIDSLSANKIDIDIHYPTLLSHPEYMEKFRKGGLEVNCWTCDDPGDGALLKQLGVDFITSNILE